ncbi:MAG TPA: hypothetical protein VEX64_02450 [Pyrinomonadaceae bacterium]|nr:hypothetical protein [Pyrinomonadaceae bacterium]
MKLKKRLKRYVQQLDFQLHKKKLSLKYDSFSSFNEEQILKDYVAELLPEDDNRFFVDIGAGDGVRRSNTYAFVQEGWRGLGVESDVENTYKLAKAYKYYPNAALCRMSVTPDNVIPLLQAYQVEKNFGVLSLDIDSYDYWVLDAVFSEYRPQIVVTEINEKIPPPVKFAVKFIPDFRMTHHFYGYSIASLAELCEKHGYAIVNLEYNNAFLVPHELSPTPLSTETIYRQGYLDRADRLDKFPLNADMEPLYSLNAEDALKFINDFYARDRDKFEASI